MIVAAASAPVATVPILSDVTGPAGPWGRTNERVCDGAVPLMLTAAVAPVLTLPIDSEFAGPVGPG